MKVEVALTVYALLGVTFVGFWALVGTMSLEGFWIEMNAAWSAVCAGSLGVAAYLLGSGLG